MHSCSECPAKFFKYATFMHHKSLHGCDDKYKCDKCNYAVKTIGNLARHKMIHDDYDREGKTDSGLADMEEMSDEALMYTDDVPMSGIELLERKLAMEKEDSKPIPRPSEIQELMDPTLQPITRFLEKDPAKRGNPDFFYPTYTKNGKVKTKRYKCPKCPTAVEKREQYEVHLRLHGSKSKHTCDRCDYSVKYYCNFKQHQEKHLKHEEQMKQIYGITVFPPKETEKTKEQANIESEVGENQEQFLPSNEDNDNLTLVEKQQVMLAELQAIRGGKKGHERKLQSCYFCPYTCTRKDHLENHYSRHKANGSFFCPLCDYRATQSNFLREHMRYHFKHSKFCQPEVFMDFGNVEIWAHGVGDKSENIEETSTLEIKEEPTGNGSTTPTNENVSENTMETPSNHEKIIAINLEELTKPEPEEENELPLAVVELSTGNIVGGEYMTTLPHMKEPDEPLPNTPYKKKKEPFKRQCPYCPVAIDRKSRLQNHISLHGSDNPYKCNKCNYAVPHLANLKKHERVHELHNRRNSEDSGSGIPEEDEDTSYSEGIPSGSCTPSMKGTPIHAHPYSDMEAIEQSEEEHVADESSLMLMENATLVDKYSVSLSENRAIVPEENTSETKE